MSEKIRKLKEEAARLIARGKLAEACGCYEQIVRAEPRDLTARQKVAELYGRLGRKADAVRAYQSVAGSYAADGLLLKAIAVCKIILQLDPAHKETQQILATLTTRRRGADAPAEATVEMPRAMSAALTPTGKKSASQIRGVSAGSIRPKSQAEVSAELAAELVRRGAEAPAAPATPADPHEHVIELTNEAPLELTHELTPEATSEPAPRSPASPAGPASGSSLGRQPYTSPAEIARLAEQLRAQPTPAQQQESEAEALLLEEVAFDIAIEDPPLVVGAPLAATPPILTAAIAAATPTFDELMAMTADVGADLTLPSGAPVSDEASFAALREEVGARIDLGDGPLLPTGQAAPPPPPTADVAFDDGTDGADVVDLSDAEVEAARVDVGSVAPIPLFSDLPKDAFVALTERMGLRVASKGEVLIAEDEIGTSMFVIIQGRVKITRRDASAGDGTAGVIELAELGDGSFFGEGALLSDAPRTASVTCVEETMVFEISRDLVAQMTADYPTVGEVMRQFHKNRLITNLLKTSVIFAPFSTAEKKALIERFKSRHVEEGTYLVTREKPGDGLYVVLSGRCEVLDAGPEGKDVVVAELRDGDVFGEMSMLWNKETCASVRASTSCVVLRLPRQSFSEVIMTYPQILESLSTLSERRQRQNTELRGAI